MRRIAATLVLLAGAGSAAGGPLDVLFETFESLSTNNFYTVSAGGQIVTDSAVWNVTQTSVDVVATNGLQTAKVVSGHDGQIIDIHGSPGPGAIETLITLDEGAEYEVSFDYGHLLISDWASMRVEVFGADDSVLLDDAVIHFNESLGFFTGRFFADGSEATLRFTGLDSTNINGGVTLDNIGVIEVIPTPAAASVLGLAGLAGLRRRR